ncbi:hypothetical protein D3C71_1201780 [compost metagenome]
MSAAFRARRRPKLVPSTRRRSGPGWLTNLSSSSRVSSVINCAIIPSLPTSSLGSIAGIFLPVARLGRSSGCSNSGRGGFRRGGTARSAYKATAPSVSAAISMMRARISRLKSSAETRRIALSIAIAVDWSPMSNCSSQATTGADLMNSFADTSKIQSQWFRSILAAHNHRVEAG